MLRTARFLRTWLKQENDGLVEEEVTIPVAGRPREATLLHPRGGGERPGWVVLQGLSVHGRQHPALKRFARSLAASGASVLLPEEPAWTSLRLDPDAARETLSDAVVHLSSLPGVRPGGVGAVGFSFGATQAVMAASDPRLEGKLRAVLAFGGYCDVGRMLRCVFTGEHEWNGVRHRLDPDPYGRWVVVGNYMTLVPGYEHMEALQAAAYELAVKAGTALAWAWEPQFDPLKLELRARLSPDEQRVWDVIAPPPARRSTSPPPARSPTPSRRRRWRRTRDSTPDRSWRGCAGASC